MRRVGLLLVLAGLALLAWAALGAGGGHRRAPAAPVSPPAARPHGGSYGVGGRQADVAGLRYTSADLAPTSACPTWSSSQLLCLHNFTRRRHGLVPLKADPRLYTAARNKRGRVIQCGAFTHYPCGDNPFEYFPAGACGSCGENMAYGYPTIRDTYAAWLNSPGHYSNIVDPTFRYYGSALAVSGLMPHLWVTDFASQP